MPSSYPGSIDSFNNPDSDGGDDLDTPGVLHDEQHANANDAIEAIEATLGTNPQGGSANVKERIAAVEGDATAAQATADAALPLAGGTMAGPIEWGSDPATDDELARKYYVDGVASEVLKVASSKRPLLQSSAGYWTPLDPLQPDQVGVVRDLKFMGHDMELVEGDLSGGPAVVYPSPTRGRNLFSPGWDDMYIECAYQESGTPAITEIDVSWEGDLARAVVVDPGQQYGWIAHQGSESNADFSWAVGIDPSTSRVTVFASSDGVTVDTVITTSASIPDGEHRAAVTVDAATGDLNLYQQEFGEPVGDFDAPYATWTLLDTVSGSGPVALFDSSAPIRHSAGPYPYEDKVTVDGDEYSLEGWATSLYRLRVRDTVEGDDLAYLDVGLIPYVMEWYDETKPVPAGGQSDARQLDFPGRSGETWVIVNYLTNSVPVVVVDYPGVVFGSGAYGRIPVDDYFWDYKPGDTLSIWIAYTQSRISPVMYGGALFAHKAGSYTGETVGYALVQTIADPDNLFAIIADGVTPAFALAPTYSADGKVVVAGMVLDGEGDEFTGVINGQAGTGAPISTVGTIENPGKALCVGSYPDGITSDPLSFVFLGMAVFRRKLTAYEATVTLPYELGLTQPIPDP